jgi:hypothetical protein
VLRSHWKAIVVIGLLGGGLHNVLQYWGLHYTSATNGAILNAMTPILILPLGALLLREPPAPQPQGRWWRSPARWPSSRDSMPAASPSGSIPGTCW